MSIYNDDFCDLVDGSDEPRTSACSFLSNSRFDCGHGIFIFSSRVNDGVIDCTNGLDEVTRVVARVGDQHVVGSKVSLRRENPSHNDNSLEQALIANIEQHSASITIIFICMIVLGCCRCSRFRFRLMKWLRGEKLPVHVS